jgi:hypothetical protein
MACGGAHGSVDTIGPGGALQHRSRFSRAQIENATRATGIVAGASG